MPYRMTKHADNVHSLQFDDVRAGWEQWVMLRSDVHHDSAHCDRKLEMRHLQKARERNAIIIETGDTFDVMQGHFDPRGSKSDLRVEDKQTAYLDAVVNNAAKDYAPYADLWALMGQGNHETSQTKRHGVDLIAHLVDKLNLGLADNGQEHRVYTGGYGGWIRFSFKLRGTVGTSKLLKYFHGAGGSSPVTKGVIDTARQAVYLPDADFVINGHNHNAYVVPVARERISQSNKMLQDTAWHIRVPGYKNDYHDGKGGWAVERGMPPKPRGCAWIRFWAQDDTIASEVVLDTN